MPARGAVKGTEPSVVIEEHIPEKYNFFEEGNDEPTRLLTDFSAKNEKDEQCRVEHMDQCASMHFVGTLVLPSELGDPQDTTNVRLNRTLQWCFDFTPENKGIFIQTDLNTFGGGCWYKLLEPSDEYRPLFEPLRKKADILIAVHSVLSKHPKAKSETIWRQLKELQVSKNELTKQEMLDFLEKHLPNEGVLAKIGPKFVKSLKKATRTKKDKQILVDPTILDTEDEDNEAVRKKQLLSKMAYEASNSRIVFDINYCKNCQTRNNFELVACNDWQSCGIMYCRKCVFELGWDWDKIIHNFKCPICMGFTENDALVFGEYGKEELQGGICDASTNKLKREERVRQREKKKQEEETQARKENGPKSSRKSSTSSSSRRSSTSSSSRKASTSTSQLSRREKLVQLLTTSLSKLGEECNSNAKEQAVQIEEAFFELCQGNTNTYTAKLLDIMTALKEMPLWNNIREKRISPEKLVEFSRDDLKNGGEKFLL